MALTGSCFCAEVTYELSAPLGHAQACHCSRCRKIFAGPSSAYAWVTPGSFRWSAGESLLTVYETGADWALAFCSRCGSALAGIHGDTVHGVMLGTVDGDPGVELAAHIFVGSKAPWDHIGGDVPQYQGHRPRTGLKEG